MCIYIYMYSTWQMLIYIYVVDKSYVVQHIQEGQKAGLRMNTLLSQGEEGAVHLYSLNFICK